MSGSVIPVKPGTPVQLSGSNVSDTTLYNMDTVNAVWVGNSPSVAPNSGMRIGPLGTAHWAKAAGLAYACVDTGVATTINLNISNDISDPANPVDVATATAIALLAQGVPNALVLKTIANQVMNANDTLTVDVSAYASITLECGGPASANVVLQCQFFDVAGIGEIFTLSAPGGNNVPPGNVTVGIWDIPVNFPSFKVTLPAGSANGTTVIIKGTNRPVNKLRQHYNEYLPRQFTFNGNFVAGTTVDFVSSDGIPDQSTRFNGPVKLHVNTNAAANTAPGFDINFAYVNLNAINANPLITVGIGAPNITNNASIDWVHPSIPMRWRIFPNATIAGALVILTVLPSGSGF